jgi:hypothetical protein
MTSKPANMVVIDAVTPGLSSPEMLINNNSLNRTAPQKAHILTGQWDVFVRNFLGQSR